MTKPAQNRSADRQHPSARETLMRRFWLKIKELFYGAMTRRAHQKYVQWRDKLLKVQMELNPSTWDHLSPNQKEKVRDEIDRMFVDLDRIEKAERLTRMIIENAENRARYQERSDDHPWN